MTTKAIKGAEVDVSISTEPTLRLGWCGPESKREEESADFKNMYSTRFPPPPH